MSSKSAKIVVVLVVAVIAFCFAGVCASLTGEISLGLNESNNTFDFNLTNDSSQDDAPVEDTSYSEPSYDTSDSYDSSQDDYYEESAGNGHQHQGGENTGGEPSQPQEPPTGGEDTPSEG
mgnify:CR=1 FL=1